MGTPTWQLRVNLLHQVLWEVVRHLSTDVYQHPGVCGGDLVDQDRAGVGQDQLGVVRFELGAVLVGKSKEHLRKTQRC